MSTYHNLVVCSLRISKPVPIRKPCKSLATYWKKWVALKDKEMRKQFASSMASTFSQLPNESEDVDEIWSFFRSTFIALAVECCGKNLLRVAGG